MDWNNDGKVDLLLGERTGYMRVYINTGTADSPYFSSYSQLVVGGTLFYSASPQPAVVDWNNDGKKDLVCGESAGRVLLMLNTGTDASPSFGLGSYVLDGSLVLSVGTYSAPVVVDWNRDGRKDLIVGNSTGYVWYYPNIGTDECPMFSGSVQLRAGGAVIVDSYAVPEVADWNNDGLPDLLCGGSDGRVRLFLARDTISFLSQETADANGNGLSERNEVVTLTSTVWSTCAATNVVATLSSTSPWCVVQQGSWYLGDLAAGVSAKNSDDPFQALVAADAPFGARIPLQVVVSANGGSLADTNVVYIDVAQPRFAITGLFLNDHAGGNGNCAIDAGERLHLAVRLANSGIRAENVTASLSSTSSYLACFASNTVFGCLEENAAGRNSMLPLAFDISAGCPSNYVHSLQLEVRCPGVTTNRLPFKLWGATDYLVDAQADFAWIDTSGGTRVYPGNESAITAEIGFSFPYYGGYSNQATICANGALTLNKQTAPKLNVSIPSPGTPNTLIAPFWDDLDPSVQGIVRYELFGAAPNRYFVAEWNQVPHASYSGGAVTVQAILHENGAIKFQYGVCTGAYGAGRNTTIGIEDAMGQRGCLISYHVAGAVSNGMAVLFTPRTQADSNTNGLPDAFERFYFGELGVSPDADADGDGLSNQAEFRAGTDPVDSISCLRIERTVALPGQLVVDWQSIPGRAYSVLQSPLLTPQSWSNAMTVVGDLDGTNSYTGTVNPSAPAGFILIRSP